MNSLKVVEYKTIRVLTTQQLAEAYGTDSKIIANNFNRNKSRYVEGKHYICLDGEEKRTFLNNHQIDDGSKNATKIYLWTEKGTFLHAKSLNTDVAWEVYDRLVDSYFRNQQKSIELEQLSPELRMFNQIFTSVARQELEQKRQAEQLNRIEQKQEVIFDTFAKDSDEDFQAWAKKCISRIAESPNYCYGQSRGQKYALATNESYERLNRKRPCRLNDRVQKAVGRAIEENPSIKKSELDKITKMYVIVHDKDLKTAYELVLKEMTACYCEGLEIWLKKKKMKD